MRHEEVGRHYTLLLQACFAQEFLPIIIIKQQALPPPHSWLTITHPKEQTKIILTSSLLVDHRLDMFKPPFLVALFTLILALLQAQIWFREIPTINDARMVGSKFLWMIFFCNATDCIFSASDRTALHVFLAIYFHLVCVWREIGHVMMNSWGEIIAHNVSIC